MRTALPALASELGTTDRTLRRALAQGLIRGHRSSPRTVRVPARECDYLRNAWPLLADLRSALRTEPGVRLAVLFGSQARGDAGDSSDVDVLVDLRPGVDARAVTSRLSASVGRRVELVRVDDARHAPLLLAGALREGRLLVDRNGAWPRLLREQSRIERAAQAERRRIEARFAQAFGATEAA